VLNTSIDLRDAQHQPSARLPECCLLSRIYQFFRTIKIQLSLLSSAGTATLRVPKHCQFDHIHDSRQRKTQVMTRGTTPCTNLACRTHSMVRPVMEQIHALRNQRIQRHARSHLRDTYIPSGLKRPTDDYSTEIVANVYSEMY